MTASPSTYTVGRGKPPLHTRFQKGQSGNPSGKPGPAKLAQQRFQRALLAVLESRPEEVESSKPESLLAAIARKMALDASQGRSAAVRQVLSLLKKESERSTGMEDDAAEQLFTGAELLSLLQGKAQGNEQWLEDILWPHAAERQVPLPASARAERIDEPAKIVATPARNEAEPFSLVQGKTQGNGNKKSEQICPALRADRAPAAGRAQLMTGTAAVYSGRKNQRLGSKPFNNYFVSAGLVPAAHEHGLS